MLTARKSPYSSRLMLRERTVGRTRGARFERKDEHATLRAFASDAYLNERQESVMPTCQISSMPTDCLGYNPVCALSPSEALIEKDVARSETTDPFRLKASSNCPSSRCFRRKAQEMQSFAMFDPRRQEAVNMDENKFLHEVEIRAELTRAQAFNVAIAVLQELHDRLSPKEADDLAAQLPGEFKSRWHAFDAPGRKVRRTHKNDFVRHIAETAEIDEGKRKQGADGHFQSAPDATQKFHRPRRRVVGRS